MTYEESIVLKAALDLAAKMKKLGMGGGISVNFDNCVECSADIDCYCGFGDDCSAKQWSVKVIEDSK